MAAMVCHGAFDRNPDLKILCVENGGDWVDHLFTSLKDTYKKMPQAFHEHPIEAFRRSV